MTQTWWESFPDLFKTSSTTFIPWMRTWSFISKYVSISIRCSDAFECQQVRVIMLVKSHWELLLCRFHILKSIWTKSGTCWMVCFGFSCGFLSLSFRPRCNQGESLRHGVYFPSPPQWQRPTFLYTRIKTGCPLSRWDTRGFIFILRNVVELSDTQAHISY